jgi:hypothetical protein|nr:MAG TPA: hypothetical protein [Caudoviricetes sp.]
MKLIDSKTKSDITKYLKQKESNISKSNHKSKHKHHYEECLIQYRSTFIGKTCLNTDLYTYCTICGKINERFKENKSIVKDYIRTVDTPIGKCYSHISGEELYESTMINCQYSL